MIEQGTLENQAKIVYLAIGSNLGNKKLNIERAKSKLQYFDLKILKCSKEYETKSWPNPKKPMFINIILEIQTNLKPLELLKICNFIEKKLGRKKSKKNEPRTCDIDIIDYDQKVIQSLNNILILPHPSMTTRNFVLIPLFEINRSWKHPKSKAKIVNLINSLPIEDLRSIKQI